MKALFVFFAFFFFAAAVLAENPPFWWSHSATAVYESGALPSNKSPANQAQLKNTARNAKHYLDRSLEAQGGAGPLITALVLSFEPRSNQGYTPSQIAVFKRANRSPVNLGQAKAVTKVFYDRLLAVGYNTRQNLIDNGATGWTYDYPWVPSTPAAQNYYFLNIGQLKLMFSFAFDADHNGLDDHWEQRFFGATGQNPTLDPDVDGLTNAQENALWTDPLTWNDPDALDTNGDGILDAFASDVGYSVTDLDIDNDGIINATEYALGTNPFWFDSDGDGTADGLDQFPLDGSQSQFPAPGGDTVAPTITLVSPDNVTLLP